LYGHSYGSTTSSVAATLTAPGVVDNLILTGSPGTGVWDASEWNVPPGQAYYSAATPRVVTVGPYPDPASGDMIYPDPAMYGQVEQDMAVNLLAKVNPADFAAQVTRMPGVTALSGVVGEPTPSGGLASMDVALLHSGYLNYADESTGKQTVSGSLGDITRVIVGQYP